MTWDEFRGEWLPAHCAAFTGIRTWLSRTTKGADAPSETQVLKGWYGVLREVDLEAALAASQRMHAGEVEEPKGFDRHPAAIRRACGVSRRSAAVGPRFDADGNQTYACRDCCDEGWIRCWHPVSIKAAREERLGQPGTIYSNAVVCHCPAGNRHDGRREYPRFDRKRCLPLIDNCDAKDQERLIDFVEGLKPTNYDPAFAEFA